ncbi:MAG: dihydrolipoyl dehydrogenase [Spirochaetota bacterium]
MASYDYDVAIIGAGPGGYVAGIRAAQLGLKAAVIEKDKPGGVCLNIGCIPSKALIHQADVYRSIADLQHMGVSVDPKGLDYAKVFQKSRKAADTLSKGVGFLLKKNKVELIEGTGRLAGPNEVKIDGGKSVSARAVIVATGSRPREIPGFSFDEKLVLSSTGALMLEKLPGRAVILGGGYIGVEFAHILNAFGVEVHIVELLDRLIPLEDADMSQVLARAFKKRKIAVSTSTRATGMEKKGKGLVVHIEKNGTKESIETDQLLMVVGRTPNTEELGLEELDITTEKGLVQVGEYYRTSVPSVYAVGDVVATPQLAHVASKEGEIAVEHIAGREPEPRVDPLGIPAGIYCEPQVASFGYKEHQLQEQGIAYHKATFPFRGVGKAVAVENYDGMLKVLTDPETSEILGAHVAGPEATELIHEMLLAREAELLPGNISRMIHAHPTLSEGVMEVMRAAEGWAVHA